MEKTIDCVVCGSSVADILVRPVPLQTPIGDGTLLDTEPLEVTTGGIVCNAGVTMARLGMRAAAFSYTGDDFWATFVRGRLEAEGVDVSCLIPRPGAATSTSVVLIDARGGRSFAHCAGAHRQMTAAAYREHFELFARSRMMLLGYYSLMPRLQDDLPQLLAAMRAAGCRTALDAAGSGGGMQPLDRLLPHLDVYVPSFREASHQTGRSDPREILATYRDAGAVGLVGVKLGAAGALLSPAAGEYVEIPAVTPPGAVVDTTGAGDCFYAGLLTGLVRGMSVFDAGRLAAAVAACSITAPGATAGIRDFDTTCRLAGMEGKTQDAHPGGI